ncbi:MAG: DUF2148 domain-containing protein [Desulfobacter sp.]
MGHLIGDEYLRDHLLEVAKNIVLAIKKAPAITGRTQIETEIVYGDDIVPIIEVLEPVSRGQRYIQWDYETIKSCHEKGETPVIIGIGAKVDNSNLGWNCGACGFPTCREYNAYAKDCSGGGPLGGPSCNWKLLDYAIACDWACASAWQYKVDNRIMGSVGFAMAALGMLPDSNVKLGLALGPARDMVYYNREEMNRKITYEEEKTEMLKSASTMFTCFSGNGNPMYKTKDRWWTQPERMDMGFSQSAVEEYEKIVRQQVPEIVMKHVEKIAARYKKKK